MNEQEQHNVVWYEKTFLVEEACNYVLHFEGVDYYTQVWLNGELLGDPRGGYETLVLI
ncbi:sugar-binding domain-containing protein [Enterococcus sp. LJL98]